MSHPLAPPDPGLQPERTVLAWGRTLMALVVVGALFVRWLPSAGIWALVPLLVALLGGGAIFAARSRMQRRAIRSIVEERADASVASVLALTGLVVVIGLSAILVI